MIHVRCVRFCFAVAWFLLLPMVTWGQDVTGTVEDADAIRQAAVKFVEAFNGKNAAALAELFDPGARYEDADGTVLQGREEIAAAFAATFEEEPKAAIGLTVDSLRFLTPDVAAEQGSTQFFPDGKMLTSRSRYLVLHLKRDHQWRMIASRSLDQEVVSNYEYLRSLDWMVGDWVDERADSLVDIHCYWDESRSFLLEDFQVRTADGVQLKGTQRIGYDPQSKQFRGWTFDSQGGFGETRWTRSEEGWIVTGTGVTANGANISFRRELVRRGPDHIIALTTDRQHGAQRLPDFEITMARKAPAPAGTAP